MAKQITHVSIFLASPSDLNEERKAVRQVIDELNGLVRQTMNVHLDLLAWETDAYPSAGVDAQDVINSQIGDEYDIFIGMMWQRFGTPTGRAGSGTEEEFERAYSRFVESSGKTKIMLYFSSKPIQPDEVDFEQLGKVRTFKLRAQELGILHWPFNDVESFQKALKMHLIKQISDLNNGLNNGSIKKVNDNNTVDDTSTELDEVEDEVGYFDLLEVYSESFSQIEHTLEKMTGHIEELGAQISRKAEKLDSLNKLPKRPINTYRVLLDSSAADMTNYVDLTAVELPRFHDLFTAGIDAFSSSLTKANSIGDGMGNNDLREIIISVSGMRKDIVFAADSIASFREVVSGVPPVAKSVNRATRLLRNTLDNVVTEFGSSIFLLDELEKIINSIIDDRGDGESSAEEI